MRFRISSFLIFIIFFTNVKSTLAINLTIDSTKYEQRTFSSDKITKLKKEKKYDYGKDVKTENNINPILDAFSRFLEQIAHTLFDNWQNLNGFGVIIRIIIYLAFFGFVFYGIYQIFNLKNIFNRKKKIVVLDYDIENENIHELDFNQLIQGALKDQQYRLAVRLHYLSTLKKLNDHELINWSIEKTNMHYIIELKANYKSNFIALTSIFDWVWYGEHSIAEDEYKKIENQFLNFNKGI